MIAALLWAAASLRRYVRGAVALGLLLACGGGLAVDVASGADRASSAFSRLLIATHAPDGYLFLSNDSSVEQKVEHLPQVLASAHVLVLAPGSSEYTPVVLTDRRFGADISGFKYLSGRRPIQSNEAMVGFTQARSQHLRVGSTLTMPVPGTSPTTSAAVKVVGVVADTRAFPPLQYTNEQGVYLDASFLQTPAGRLWQPAPGGGEIVAVRIHGGAPAFGSFLESVERIQGGPIGSDTLESEAAGPERSMHLQSLALWMAASFGALVVLAVVSQLLLRQLAEHRATSPALRSLGMTTGQLVFADLVWVGSIALAAAIGAALVAWAGSPLFPLGTARVADPHPGFAFDGAIIGPGAAILVGTVLAVGALVSWNQHRTRRPLETPPAIRLGTPVRLQRLPIVVSTGMRLALRSGSGPNGRACPHHHRSQRGSDRRSSGGLDLRRQPRPPPLDTEAVRHHL
jgi:hypothetical protein